MKKIYIFLIFVFLLLSFLFLSQQISFADECDNNCQAQTQCAEGWKRRGCDGDSDGDSDDGYFMCCKIDKTGQFCRTDADCGAGYECDNYNFSGQGSTGGHCKKILGGGGENGSSVNLKCNCTTEFGACGDNFGKTDIQWRQCQKKVNGTETCNWRVGLKLYQYKACEAGPTPTPGGPTLTPIPTGADPTPTDNPNCRCNALNSCTNACTFDKYTDVTYNNPIKCGVANNKFQSNPTAANKNAWCRAEKKTKGDADLNGVVNLLDYFYFIQSKIGAKVPSDVNPDFNGDNQINNDDSAIIIKTLKTGGF